MNDSLTNKIEKLQEEHHQYCSAQREEAEKREQQVMKQATTQELHEICTLACIQIRQECFRKMERNRQSLVKKVGTLVLNNR